MHVIGGSGTGKSKLVELMARGDAHEGQGLCVMDWHGTLYKDLLEWFAFHDIGLLNDFRKVVLMNISHPDFVTGFNPFRKQAGDVSTQVSRRIAATVKPWGQENSNEMPTFERVCRIVYTCAVEMGETLPNVVQLIDMDNRELRELALKEIPETRVRVHLQKLQKITSSREWKEDVLSLDNRLTRFLGSQTIQRFIGLKENNIDLMDVMDKGTIVLVNLADSDFLSRDEARVIATWFLSDFFDAAMRRAERLAPGEEASPYVLYLDEFQEYITPDLAAMLDQVRKGGLHLVLSHQHLGHFVDDPRLRKSVFTNARIRAVFGGLDYEDGTMVGNEMFLPDLNARQIKKAYYHTIHLYQEETRTIHGHAHGSGSSHLASSGLGSGETMPGGELEGWFSSPDPTSRFSSETSADAEGETEYESDSEVEVPVFVPIPKQELTSETEWTREEKLSKIAEMLKEQQQRHCFIKIDLEKTQPLKVANVKRHPVAPKTLEGYEQATYKSQGALPAKEVDQLITEGQRKLLERAGKHAGEEDGSVDPDDVWQSPKSTVDPSKG